MDFKLILVTMFIVFFLSTQIFSAAQEKGSDKDITIKGVFGLPVDNAVLKGRSYDEIARYLKSLGVNTVIGVPLNKELIGALHAQNIRAYAEVAIFAGQEYWIRNPNSRPINLRGKPIAKQNWYCGLCPTQEWLRKEKLDSIRSIVENFDVDGIWLDFIRYPCHWEVISPVLEDTCFCHTCIEKFKTDTGISLPPDLETVKDKAEFIINSHSLEWYTFRCEQITSFVREVKKVLTDKSPRLKLGLFAVPWREGEFNNAIINIIAQDFKKLSSYVDVFSPMAYHKMCGKDINWISQISKYMQDKTAKKVVPILQAMDVSKEELAQGIRKTLSNNQAGLVVFEMSTIINDKKEETIKSTFGNSAL